MQLACLLKAFFIELGYPKSTSNINIQLKHSPENKNLVPCLSDCKYKPTHPQKKSTFSAWYERKFTSHVAPIQDHTSKGLGNVKSISDIYYVQSLLEMGSTWADFPSSFNISTKLAILRATIISTHCDLKMVPLTLVQSRLFLPLRSQLAVTDTSWSLKIANQFSTWRMWPLTHRA